MNYFKTVKKIVEFIFKNIMMVMSKYDFINKRVCVKKERV